MNATYRAWLAGFFDGEGNVGVLMNHGHPHPVIQIVQKDRAILDSIRDAFGCGTVSRFTNGVHILRFGGRKNTLTFIEVVLPYAVIKREKLQAARELALTIGTGQKVPDEVKARRLELAAQLRVRPSLA